MASGQKSHNAPTEEFILASPAPVDVAAKISAIYRILAEHVSIQLKSRAFLVVIILNAFPFSTKQPLNKSKHISGKRSCHRLN